MKYDLVNFTNIDDEDFVCNWDGEEYLIKAGDTKAFPGFLVDHLIKHLVNKILLKKGVDNYGNPIKREPLEKQIKGEIVLEKSKTEDEGIKEEIEKTQKELEDSEEERKDEVKQKRIETLANIRKAKATKATKAKKE